MDFTTLDNLLWAAGFCGHVALLVVLLVRRRSYQMPVLTSLLAYQVGVTAILFLISRFGTRHAYFLGYWITVFGDYCFQLALILEIARAVLRPTGTWIQDARRSFLLWSAGALLVALIFALTVGPPGARGLDLWEVRGRLFTSLLTCELFIAMVLAANRLGLLWRSHVMAVGQGITIWAMISLLGDVGHVALGWSEEFLVLDHLRMFVYLGVLVFWSIIFWLPEQQRAPLSPQMQDYLLALQRRVQYDLDKITR